MENITVEIVIGITLFFIGIVIGTFIPKEDLK